MKTPSERAKALLEHLFDDFDGWPDWWEEDIASAIRDAENAKIAQVLHLVAQREIAKELGAEVIGTHWEAISNLKSKGT